MLGQMEALHSLGKHVDPTAADSLDIPQKRGQQDTWCQNHEKVQVEPWWQYQQNDHQPEQYDEGGKLCLELGPKCPVQVGDAHWNVFSSMPCLRGCGSGYLTLGDKTVLRN